MTNFIYINALLIVFYSIFFFGLRKSTFHIHNRFYLLGSVIIAVLFPFVNFSGLENLLHETAIPQNILGSTVVQYSSSVKYAQRAIETQQSIDAFSVFLIIYGTIVTALTARLAYRFYIANRYFINNETNLASTFLGKIKVSEQSEFTDVIYSHEAVHKNQFHYIDLILAELLCVLFWINPVVYFYRKSLKITHEFIADEVASSLLDSKQNYAELLLSKKTGLEPSLVFTNFFFNKSALLTRIKMLATKPTHPFHKLKYLTILPVLGISVLLSSMNFNPKAPKLIKKITAVINEPFKQDTLKPKKEIEALKIDTPAEYKAGQSALEVYLAFNLQYPTEAEKEGIEGTVIVNFVVNQQGDIENIKAETELGYGLEEEAVRLVSNMPKWKPAMANNLDVSSKVSLPIVFKSDKKGFDFSEIIDESPLPKPKEIILSGNFSFNIEDTQIQTPKFRFDPKQTTNIRIGNHDKPRVFVNFVEILYDDIGNINPNEIQKIEVIKNNVIGSLERSSIYITTKKK